MKREMKFLLIGGTHAHEDTRKYILEEAKKLFDTVLSVPLNKIRVECVNGKNKLYYKNQDLTTFDACYARLFAKDFVFGEIVLDILNNSKCYMPTCVEAYQITNHKYYTVKVLSEIGIPVPTTALSVSPESALDLTHKIGFPAVIKLLSGFGGKGVMLSNSETEFKPVLDTLKIFKEFICSQQYLPSEGADLRYYIFGKEVVAVKRQGRPGEWRANISRGGHAQIVETDQKLRNMALKSAQMLGLDICAVDFIETEQGPKVIEINFTPGPIIKFFGSRLVKHLVRALYDNAVQHKKKRTGW